MLYFFNRSELEPNQEQENSESTYEPPYHYVNIHDLSRQQYDNLLINRVSAETDNYEEIQDDDINTMLSTEGDSQIVEVEIHSVFSPTQIEPCDVSEV